jgi:hypothetical protein
VDVKWLGGDYPNIVFSSDDHTIRHFAPHDLTSKIFRYHDAMVWVCFVSTHLLHFCQIEQKTLISYIDIQYVDGSYWLNQLASASADGTVKVLPLSQKIMASTKVKTYTPHAFNRHLPLIVPSHAHIRVSIGPRKSWPYRCR